MIDLCKRCVKNREYCKTLFTEVKLQTNTFPIKVLECKHFENRIEEGHVCSDYVNKDLPDCGANIAHVNISGGRIFYCTKHVKEEK